MSEVVGETSEQDFNDYEDPDRLITITPDFRVSILEQLIKARQLSVKRGGVGVELTGRHGFNVGVVYPDTDIITLYEESQLNIQKMNESQRAFGRSACTYSYW